MRFFSNIIMLSISNNFLRSTLSFQYFPQRYISKSSVIMRSKRKTSIDAFYDNIPKSRSKQLVPNYEPRTDNQRKYLDLLNNDHTPIVLGVGPAGCGKTMFACLQAIQELKSGNINKIILTRPIVPVEEEELGFLPGNLVKKMDPWTRPIFDIFSEFYQQHDIENMIHCGILEISPLAYMRGRTFKRSFIIADEMQNSTPNQMLMLTTRIGDKSKLVITGDLKQSDRTVNNGLLDIIEKLKTYKQTAKESRKIVNVELIEMGSNDIQRSPIVSQILEIYNSTNIQQQYEINNLISSIDNYAKQDSIMDTDSNRDAALIPKNKLPRNEKNSKK